MEAGDVETVIKSPQHPYTQLLIDSIPWQNLEQRWGAQKIITREASAVSGGCPFYSRCARAMDRCKAPSPMYRLAPFQAASCYLYEDHEQMDAAQLSETLPV